MKDVRTAPVNPEYPGMRAIYNDRYKTATIYGEKYIVISNHLYDQLITYVDKIWHYVNGSETCQNLFTKGGNCSSLKSSTVLDMLCSSFNKARVFAQSASSRFSFTRIRVALATFAINTGNINQGYFAFHFMKNKEATTVLHYNVLSDQREAIRQLG